MALPVGNIFVFLFNIHVQKIKKPIEYEYSLALLHEISVVKLFNINYLCRYPGKAAFSV